MPDREVLEGGLKAAMYRIDKIQLVRWLESAGCPLLCHQPQQALLANRIFWALLVWSHA